MLHGIVDVGGANGTFVKNSELPKRCHIIFTKKLVIPPSNIIIRVFLLLINLNIPYLAQN